MTKHHSTQIMSYNPSTARYCRQRYYEHFTQQQFEENLISIFSS